MKKIHLLIACLLLFAIACKKHPPELKPTPQENSVSAQEPEISDASGPCYGNTWVFDEDFPADGSSAGLVHNNKYYVFNKGFGDPAIQNTISIFDGTSWQNIPSAIPVQMDYEPIYFKLGSKAYFSKAIVSNGQANPPYKLWEYDFNDNTWTQKANFPGAGRRGAACFTIEKKAYVYGGSLGSTYYNDLWEYNSLTNTWTQKANSLGVGRAWATAFSISGKGYVVTGETKIGSTYLNLSYMTEYDPATNDWDPKTAFPGDPRHCANVFVISGKAYVGAGFTQPSSDGTFFRDFYKYDAASDSWGSVADVPGVGNLNHGFTINSKGYINNYGLGFSQLIKYTPKYCISIGPTP